MLLLVFCLVVTFACMYKGTNYYETTFNIKKKEHIWDKEIKFRKNKNTAANDSNDRKN